MSSFSYEDYQNFHKSKGTNQNYQNNKSTNYVPYFDIKENGGEAIVRFMYDSPEEFRVFTVHNLQINKKWKKIDCLNDQHSTDKCPLCLAGNKTQNRFLIKLIHYTKEQDGTIKATPKIWDRSTAFLSTLKNLMVEYGPLSENVFKIKRNGAFGSQDTKYDIMYASPSIYRPEVYVKDQNAFKDFDFYKGYIQSKTADEMVALLDPTPETQTASQTAQQPPLAQSTQTTTTTQTTKTYRQPTYTQPQQNTPNTPPRRTYTF